MSNSTISIGIKVEDVANGLKTPSFQAAELQKFMNGAVSETQKLHNSFINFAAISSGLANMSSSLQTVISSISGLTQAYDAQKQAETQMFNIQATVFIQLYHNHCANHGIIW